MNIFILSLVTKLCAEYHCDKHVVKMILESAQLLCSAHIILDSVDNIDGWPLYKLSHKNHPCAIWTRECSGNYAWLYHLFCDLCYEYTHRYGKIHLCEKKLKRALNFFPDNISTGKLTPFRLAMPDECKKDDPVESYREYYIKKKKDICKWKYTETPEWFVS